MTYGQLLDRIMAVAGCDAAQAMNVATMLWSHERDYTDNEITYAAVKAGAMGDPTAEPVTAEDHIAQHEGELTMDAAEVLAEVYKHSPRVLNAEMPRVGRRPRDIELPAYLEEQLAELPEDVRVCIVDIDLFAGAATFTLYDEANEVDRPIGPIDLTRYDDANALVEGMLTLMKRLPKVLASDFN